MKDELEKKTGARLTAPEQLLRDNAMMRGDLLTVATRISHDLRTPLGGIVSTGELLKEILSKQEPASASLADSLFSSVDEMSKLIGQIRIIAKATAAPQKKAPVNMGTIVAGVLQRLESRILKNKVVVTEPDFWPEVNGVAEWLEFIWWNLLANALQHAGGVSKVELSWRQENGALYFQAGDNGGGVREDMRARLFQGFDTLHQTGSVTGLGLSVVERLVNLQGGVCGYRPNPGGGSNFYFTLPVAEKQNAVPPRV